MIKGGYKIIDFKDTPLYVEGSTMMIEGIYDDIEASYRKPLLLTGLYIEDKEVNDQFAAPELSSSDFTFVIRAEGTLLKITITDTDAVSLTSADM